LSNAKSKPNPNGRSSVSNSARNASRRVGPKRWVNIKWCCIFLCTLPTCPRLTRGKEKILKLKSLPLTRISLVSYVFGFRANESVVWSSELCDTSIDEVEDSSVTNTLAAPALLNSFPDEKPVLTSLSDSPMIRQTRRHPSYKDADNKILRITSDAQLHSLCPKDVSRLITPSLRIKPRKPLNPRISVVF